MQRWAPHLLGLVTPLVAILGIIIGGWWSGSVIVLLLILYPLLDVVFGNDDAGSRVNQGRAFDIILHLHGLLVPIAIVILLWQIHVTGWNQFVALGAVSITCSVPIIKSYIDNSIALSSYSSLLKGFSTQAPSV